jgi:hypothetical protein
LEPIADTDEVLAAIDALVEALTHNRAQTDTTLKRAADMRAQRLAGHSYTDILENSAHPQLVEMLTLTVLELHDVGHRLRTVQARALRQEGLSTQRIAQLYGVSRQRIMALLRSTPGADKATKTQSVRQFHD